MLQTDKRYSATEKMKSINSLKKIQATSFDPNKLEETFVNYKNFKVIGMQIIGASTKI